MFGIKKNQENNSTKQALKYSKTWLTGQTGSFFVQEINIQTNVYSGLWHAQIWNGRGSKKNWILDLNLFKS